MPYGAPGGAAGMSPGPWASCAGTGAMNCVASASDVARAGGGGWTPPRYWVDSAGRSGGSPPGFWPWWYCGGTGGMYCVASAAPAAGTGGMYCVASAAPGGGVSAGRGCAP